MHGSVHALSGSIAKKLTVCQYTSQKAKKHVTYRPTCATDYDSNRSIQLLGRYRPAFRGVRGSTYPFRITADRSVSRTMLSIQKNEASLAPRITGYTRCRLEPGYRTIMINEGWFGFTALFLQLRGNSLPSCLPDIISGQGKAEGDRCSKP